MVEWSIAVLVVACLLQSCSCFFFPSLPHFLRANTHRFHHNYITLRPDSSTQGQHAFAHTRTHKMEAVVMMCPGKSKWQVRRADEGGRRADRGAGDGFVEGRGGVDRMQEIKVVRDLGHLNNTPLLILDRGNGPYINWGLVNTPLPLALRLDPISTVTFERVAQTLEERMSLCCVVKAVGLPLDAQEDDIRVFFNGCVIDPKGIMFNSRRDGSYSGQVFIKFGSADDANRAMELNGERMGSRYVQLFKQLSGGPFKNEIMRDAMAINETLGLRLKRVVGDVMATPVCEPMKELLAAVENSVVNETTDIFRPLEELPCDTNVWSILTAANVSQSMACKMISELGKRRKIEKAMSIYAWLKSVGARSHGVNLFHFNALISACSNSDRWLTALRLLGEMEAQGLSPDTITYSTLISACGKGRQWEVAQQLLERMTSQSVRPNIITFNALISTCEKAGRLDQALRAFDALIAAGHSPDVITYSALISACEKVGAWETAVGLFEEMKRCGLKPDVITYNALISACDKGLQPDMAQRFFEVMQSDSVPPDVISYSCLISSYASVGDSHNAERVFAELRRSDIKITNAAYNEMIRSYEAGGQYREALALLAEQEREGIPLVPFTYHLLISVCEKAGKAQLVADLEARLEKLTASMGPQDPGHVPASLSAPESPAR